MVDSSSRLIALRAGVLIAGRNGQRIERLRSLLGRAGFVVFSDDGVSDDESVKRQKGDTHVQFTILDAPQVWDDVVALVTSVRAHAAHPVRILLLDSFAEGSREQEASRLGISAYIPDLETVSGEAVLLGVLQCGLSSRRAEPSDDLASRQALVHDAANELTGALGHLHLLSKRGDSSLSSTIRSVERACLLLRRSLAESAAVGGADERVDLTEICHEVAHLLRPSLGSEIELIEDLPTEPCFVRDAGIGMYQVLINLVMNAREVLRTSPVPGVDAKITVALRRHAAVQGSSTIECSVSDNGPGISPALRSRMFEPRYSTSGGEGRGLGLFSVLECIRALGGVLSVESEDRAGAKFSFLVPEDVVIPELHPATLAQIGHGETILAIEDDESLRAVLVQMLQTLGFRVLQAADSMEGLDLVRKFSEIRIVLSDVAMPQMSGFDLYRALQDERSGVKVLLCSGYALGRHCEAKYPGLRFLQKPYSCDELAREIHEILLTT